MAYGKVRGIPKPIGEIPARIYAIEPQATDSRAAILTVPFDFAAGDAIDKALSERLRADFNDEITDGRTYPQEGVMDPAGYEGYFLSCDLVLGLFLSRDQLQALRGSAAQSVIPATGLPLSPSQLSMVQIGDSKLRTLPLASSPNISLPNPDDTYAFAYYIKPNYPGRSSHLCNAGFMVPPAARGLGLGSVAGRSFLFYAPACGYRGSVFNLVYANNAASVRIWERLGFQNVGRIPEAGRLRKKGGEEGEEEFVDAWVVYGDFRKIGYWDDGVVGS